jgi:phenolic acid decarboxylase
VTNYIVKMTWDLVTIDMTYRKKYDMPPRYIVKFFDKISILKFHSCTLGHMQITLKRFYQKFAKTITCGANVIPNYNHVNITHTHLELLSFQWLMNT